VRPITTLAIDESRMQNGWVTLPIIIGVISLAVFLALPIYVGGLVDGRGFTESQAGLISSVEMGGLALGNIFFLLLTRHVGMRALAAMSLLVIAVGNGATGLARDFDAILLMRCLSGVGGGIGFALATAMLSGKTNPDRWFSIFIVVQLVFQAVALWLGPSVLQFTSVDTCYALPAFAALAVLPFLRALPPFEPKPVRRQDVAATSALLWPVGMTLLAMLLLFAATGGVWTYLERMGAAAGLDPHQIGGALGASGIAGVIGPSVTLWLSRRSQRVLPIVIFMGLLVAAQLLLIQGTSLAAYVAAACIFNFAWNALIPYYYGVLANIDREGRAAVAGNVLATVGLSAGAAVAAGLTQGPGYTALLSLSSVACLASLALLWLPAAQPVEHD
jgi:predicted MFS family arabinose efflux permease